MTLEGDCSLTELMAAAADQCVERITGDLTIARTNGGLSADQIETLRHLTGLGDDLRIRDNAGLLDLSGLENLTEVGGLLYIGSNESLETLEGLDNLSRVGQRIAIYGNESLGSLQGLRNLRTVVDVDIKGCGFCFTALMKESGTPIPGTNVLWV